MAASPSARSARPTAVTAGSPATLEPAQHVELGRGDLARLLLERVRPAVDGRGTGRGGATGRPAGRGSRASRTATRRAAAPRAGRAGARRLAQPKPREPDRAGRAGSPSELLAQVGRHRRVVAERLVQVARLGTVVAGGHLDERRAELDDRSARPRPSASGRRRARARRRRRRARGSGRSSRRARSGAGRGRR